MISPKKPYPIKHHSATRAEEVSKKNIPVNLAEAENAPIFPEDDINVVRVVPYQAPEKLSSEMVKQIHTTIEPEINLKPTEFLHEAPKEIYSKTISEPQDVVEEPEQTVEAIQEVETEQPEVTKQIEEEPTIQPKQVEEVSEPVTATVEDPVELDPVTQAILVDAQIKAAVKEASFQELNVNEQPAVDKIHYFYCQKPDGTEATYKRNTASKSYATEVESFRKSLANQGIKIINEEIK